MTEEGSAWNMARQYYDMLMTFMSQEAQAYADNDLRELWKWLSWLYDNVWIALSDEDRSAMDAEYEQIDADIFSDTAGDKLDDLYSDSEGDISEYRRQMKRIRFFRRRLLALMQERGMILPWKDAVNLEEYSTQMR